MPSPFEAEKIYHIYTHANGNENLFREEDNYLYFLKKYTHHLYPLVETFAYCLMPNHLHLMVRVRKEEEVLKNAAASHLTGFENLSGVVSRGFSNLFNSYTKAVNKRYNRKGSLFHRPFKRKPIQKDAYFTALICYIHNNPVHHGFVQDTIDWQHSSWHTYLSVKPTKLAREEGINWFGDLEEFCKVHRLMKYPDEIMV